jgi:hypothetical protein
MTGLDAGTATVSLTGVFTASATTTVAFYCDSGTPEQILTLGNIEIDAVGHQ